MLDSQSRGHGFKTTGWFQGSTITIKLPYMITYMCQNFDVCDIHRQIRNCKIKHHTFNLMIFLTICPMLVYETNIEVSFKTSPCLNPKDTFHKLSEERVKILFFINFWYHHKLHFSRKFYWNSYLQEDMNFCFFDFKYFCQFFGFFYLYLLQKKLMMLGFIKQF